MKTSELTGALLDYWVAEAEGMLRMAGNTIEDKLGGYSPSTKWAQGGPIIERESISVEVCCYDNESDKNAIEWVAKIEPPMREDDEEPPRWIFSERRTPLAAAMLAYVTGKFGDEVEDLP